ncbi:PPK2 family polyphosphate kinase [Variovorax boronicumulans]|uniref:PPK2 family polyphosphate kinase n=1 Tax=Variovorax boronicumulans TaxID=436515 RepID=UPI001C59D698
MSRFDKYRIGAKVRLADIDPGNKGFLKGDEAAQGAQLDALAIQLDELQNLMHAEGRRKLLLVLQGTDTSGKDGTVRWVFSRTSPLGVRVAAFKAPSLEEQAHDFLWRCHAVVPRTGELAVWNRSHYEDVLVPVVEGWIDKAATQRRYAQINDFERLLTETGTVVLKCMLHIDKDEQRQRLQARIDDPSKNWKFSMGDLEARKKWSDYQRAYAKALDATSTDVAPWYVVPANSKTHRNLMIAQLLVKTLKDMKLSVPPPDPALKGLVVR